MTRCGCGGAAGVRFLTPALDVRDFCRPCALAAWPTRPAGAHAWTLSDNPEQGALL